MLGKQHLEDNILNYYLSLLVQNLPHRAQIHLYPTQFASKLLKGGYQRGQKWTKVDIFSRKMVIIPVQEIGDNPAANHWYAVVCVGVGSFEDSSRMAPRLIVMDSLSRTHEAKTKKT